MAYKHFKDLFNDAGDNEDFSFKQLELSNRDKEVAEWMAKCILESGLNMFQNQLDKRMLCDAADAVLRKIGILNYDSMSLQVKHGEGFFYKSVKK